MDQPSDPSPPQTHAPYYSETKLPTHPRIYIDEEHSDATLFSLLTGVSPNYLNDAIHAVRVNHYKDTFVQFRFQYRGMRIGRDKNGIVLELLP